MANRIGAGDPRGFNEGRSSKFCVGSRVRQTPEEGRRAYRPKCSGNNNEDGFFLSFFNGISTLFRLFNAKAILLEEQ